MCVLVPVHALFVLPQEVLDAELLNQPSLRQRPLPHMGLRGWGSGVEQPGSGGWLVVLATGCLLTLVEEGSSLES